MAGGVVDAKEGAAPAPRDKGAVHSADIEYAAIEPMINMGDWHVFIDEEDGWTVVTEDELPSAQWEHTFLMTEHGLEVLTY